MKTHILCSITFFRKSHRLWDNVEKYGGARGATNDVTIWRIRVACWISKATCTYAHAHAHALGYPHARTRKHAHTGQYVILIAFPQQQWFRERASVLRYTYIVCIVRTFSFANWRKSLRCLPCCFATNSIVKYTQVHSTDLWPKYSNTN